MTFATDLILETDIDTGYHNKRKYKWLEIQMQHRSIAEGKTREINKNNKQGQHDY